MRDFRLLLFCPLDFTFLSRQGTAQRSVYAFYFRFFFWRCRPAPGIRPLCDAPSPLSGPRQTHTDTQGSLTCRRDSTHRERVVISRAECQPKNRSRYPLTFPSPPSIIHYPPHLRARPSTLSFTTHPDILLLQPQQIAWQQLWKPKRSRSLLDRRSNFGQLRR